MQRNIIETVMGAVVLLVAAGFLFLFQKTADIKPASGYTLLARFAKIDGLETGSPVRISGVRVGRVDSFTLDRDTFQAVVKLSIDNGVRVPADTVAVVVSDGLMGGKFLSLEPGGDEVILEAGEEIEYTQSTPSLEQLLGQVIFSLNKSAEKQAGEAKN